MQDDDAVKIFELPIPAAATDTTPCDPLEETSSKAGPLSEGITIMFRDKSGCN